MEDVLKKFQDDNVVSPYNELISYETLWMREGATLKKVASEYLKNYDLPSRAINYISDLELLDNTKSFFNKININFSIITAQSYQYPKDLKDAKHQIKILYYRGDIDLLTTPKRISIVGARKASPEGLARASKIAKELVKKGYVIVSGLAEGIDTAAMTSALKNNGQLIGVIGTPINEYYPNLLDKLTDNTTEMFDF